MKEKFKATIVEVETETPIVRDGMQGNLLSYSYRCYLESPEVVIVLKGSFKSKAIAKAELDYFCESEGINRTSRIIYRKSQSYNIVVGEGKVSS